MDYYRKGAAPQSDGTEKTTSNQPQPILVTKAYLDRGNQKWALDILRLLKQPTLIPVMRPYDAEQPDTPPSIDPIRFMLIHALQILKFAPMVRSPEIDFLEGTYDRRFPSTIPGGNRDPVIMETYSMEDLNRSVVAFYMFLTRRNGSRSVTNRIPAKQANFKWYGYNDPEFRVNEAAPTGFGAHVDRVARAQLQYETRKREEQRRIKKEQRDFMNENAQRRIEGEIPLETPVALRPLQTQDALDVHEAIVSNAVSMNLSKKIKSTVIKGEEAVPHMSRETEKALMADLSSIHPKIDHEANLKRVKNQLMGFEALINQSDLADYMKNQIESPHIMEFAQKHPDDYNGLLEMIQRKFALDSMISSIAPVTQNIGNICEDYGLVHDEKGEVSLYNSDNIQKMRPHQLAGKYVSYFKPHNRNLIIYMINILIPYMIRFLLSPPPPFIIYTIRFFFLVLLLTRY